MVVGRDCLMQAQDKFNAVEQESKAHIENTRTRDTPSSFRDFDRKR
jgi:hypothetical protein